jgi:hypothetical protein
MNLVFQAWAIDTQSKEGHGLIGRYWWFDEKSRNIPEHMEGCRFALFKTRDAARKNLARVKRAFPSSKVVHVTVSIS